MGRRLYTREGQLINTWEDDTMFRVFCTDAGRRATLGDFHRQIDAACFGSMWWEEGLFDRVWVERREAWAEEKNLGTVAIFGGVS